MDEDEYLPERQRDTPRETRGADCKVAMVLVSFGLRGISQKLYMKSDNFRIVSDTDSLIDAVDSLDILRAHSHRHETVVVFTDFFIMLAVRAGNNEARRDCDVR